MYRIVKFLLRAVFNLCFRTRLVFDARLDRLGKKALFLASNLSAIDPLLILAYLPGRPVFAMPAGACRGWVRFILRCADVFIVDSTNPLSLKGLTDAVAKGRWAVMLAEGKVGESGLVAKVYEAPGLIANETGAPIVPVQIEGLQYSWFSRIKSADRRPFPRVKITFFKEYRVSAPGRGRESRERVGDHLYRVMQDAFYRTHIDRGLSIFASAMRAARLYGKKGIKRRAVVEDIERRPLSYKAVLTRSFLFAGRLNKSAKKGEHVGVMLPNSADNLCVFLALSAYGRVPAMLNFSSGEKNILNCCKMASVRKAVTSRKFVDSLGLAPLVAGMEREGVAVLFLEDLLKSAGPGARLAALMKYKRKYVPEKRGGHEAKGVILFTSGSEGMPKAVVLSQYNVMSNIAQIVSTINVGTSDVWFNALPMFHSFGLTFGTLAPFMLGIRLFLYPTPLHYRVIPEICYQIGATVMAATNTFLRNYAKNAHPYDFMAMRIVINGAEILREDTRMAWVEKFGVRIIQGYGATETSPVVTLCSQAYNRTGSIGKVVPGMEYKVKKLDGVSDGGELVVRGDNVMMGYMKLDNPGVLQPPKDGWYETGDVVEIDSDGYVFIKDRVKRFAKIAGEMVSLTAVENLSRDAYARDEELEVAAVGVPDEAKGERLVLVATRPDIDLSIISAYAKREGVSELYVPKAFIYRDAIPLLKTGKRDYVGLKEQVLSELGIGK
jgi:acyl-[acyl-carrier-protein]-phospholipid O-acyltransferase/long-chain-fatty-acid--[acyl-carrier-protein] ligase